MRRSRTASSRLYVGAGVAFADADRFEFEDAETGDFSEPVDSEISWVANAGLNFNFTPSFGAALDAKYIPYEATAGDGEEQLNLEINPLLISAGVRFRL
jgi:outer membrane protein W